MRFDTFNHRIKGPIIIRLIIGKKLFIRILLYCDSGRVSNSYFVSLQLSLVCFVRVILSLRQNALISIRLFIFHSDVLVICYKDGSCTSFSNVESKWLPEIRKHCDNKPVILAATQLDMARTDAELE